MATPTAALSCSRSPSSTRLRRKVSAAACLPFHHAPPLQRRCRCLRLAPLHVLDDSKEVETAADRADERSETDKLVDGMDFGELCNDFECISSPYVESTARQLARDILELREGNRAFNCYAVSVKYKDPLRTFVGREKYMRPLWITKALETPKVTVQEMSMQSTSTLTIKWTFRGKPKNPFFSVVGGDLIVRVDSQYVLNQISGQVLEHVESWDLSASSLPAQAYFWFSRRVYSTVDAGKDTIEAAKGTASRLSTKKDENLEAYPDPSGDPTKMATANVELPDRHEHPLTWAAEAEPFKCSGCNEDGYHVRYACRRRSCSRGRPFHLHEACAQQFGSSLPHPLKRGDLLFRNSPSQPEHPCRACGGKVTGYAYERKRRLFGCILERATVLHPCCAALPTSIEQAGLLIPVKLELQRRLKSPCCKCGHVRFEGKRRTWGYVSADKVMQIHVACANRMFREAYEAARQRKPSMVSRLIARLTRTLSGSTVNGGGGPSTERPGTGGAGSGSAGAADALPVPELPIVNVPKEKSRKECVMRAVWSTICTVGAVITGTGNPIGMIPLLIDILS